MSPLDLKIEPAMYNKTRDRLKCSFCNLNEIEDDFHFLQICPGLCSLREKYIYLKILNSRKPSVYKVIQLLSTSNTIEMCNSGKCLHYANKHRTLNVNNQNFIDNFVCTLCMSPKIVVLLIMS